ncbi:hypothetical protein [Yoonia sp.]|uniref:hypothetical protein n=1 Tax=Yoonia sp. TaxID=2212373 RepID=UPI0023B51911
MKHTDERAFEIIRAQSRPKPAGPVLPIVGRLANFSLWLQFRGCPLPTSERLLRDAGIVAGAKERNDVTAAPLIR